MVGTRAHGKSFHAWGRRAVRFTLFTILMQDDSSLYFQLLMRDVLEYSTMSSAVHLGLTDAERAAIRDVIARHTAITSARIFGSRAKGTAKHNSDVDIALDGAITPLQAAGIARELDELPLPYLFDVVVINTITSESLLAHIERVGVDV